MSLHQVQSTAVKKYSLKQLKIAERLVVSFANLDLSWVPDRKDICCPQFSCYWCIFFNSGNPLVDWCFIRGRDVTFWKKMVTWPWMMTSLFFSLS